MSATIKKPKAVLDDTQRAWLKRIADAMGFRTADAGQLEHDSVEAPPTGSMFASIANAAPNAVPLQQAPLAQSKTLPQPTTSPQKQTQPQPGVAPAKPQERFVVPVPRFDNFPITNAKTLAEVTKFVESGGRPTAVDLERYRAIAREAANFGSGDLGKNGRMLEDKIPDAAETNKIRENYGRLNEAVMYGRVEVAARIARELGLPIQYEQISLHIQEELDRGTSTHLTEKQWKTLVALGLVQVKASKTSKAGGSTITVDAPVFKQERIKELNALNGAGGFAQLVDDMAALGVTPLNGVPAHDQIQSYLEKVRAKAEKDYHGKPDKQKLISDALLKASQQLMDGMQVHYRGASDKNVEYGPTQTSLIFLYAKGQLKTGPDGKPITLELPVILNDDPQKRQKEATQNKTIQDWIRANGGDDHFITKPHTPEGWGDTTGQEVYGNRYESDCEGMASFRLRTLPPGFTPLGVVTGFLKGDRADGHLVAIFQSPDGRVFLSSNGKPPIEVKTKNKLASADEIRTAVVEEFDAIYKGDQNEDSFTFGLGKPSSSSGTSLNAVNASTDRVLKDATADEYMRTELKKNPRLKKTPPTLNWHLVAP